ncbi:hypothetical protein BDF20DRAFT_183242 [Mycotypha africana]|uniref:uncharacterized protein n=1 Tax=Mycotypha africana TaxID=64632 RepID=UPI002300F66D|nr:uncharacterized protein BDF20DRAFT_183242 [Mycotypha africana]KAI8968462.1 hypothetical protein BDF20DRAFT_183242 [Mycotypha africana]
MTISTTASTNNNKKTYKWASTNQNKTISDIGKRSHHIKKRTTSRNAHTRTVMTTASAIMTTVVADIEKHKPQDPFTEIEQLQKDLSFTYDTIATITVHFDSLHHAYISSKSELDKNKNATRLCEMEKELLTAYDDLGLQVTHLERKIVKYEKRLAQLRDSVKFCSPIGTTASCTKTSTSFRSSSVTASPQKQSPPTVEKKFRLPSVPREEQQPLQQQPQQQPQDFEQSPCMCNDALHYNSSIPSPCSSTDSLMAELKIESPDSLYNSSHYSYSNGFIGEDYMLQQETVIYEQEARLYDPGFWCLSDMDNYGLCSDTNNNKLNITFTPPFPSWCQQQDYFQQCGNNSFNYYYNNINNSTSSMGNDMFGSYYPTSSQYYQAF